MTMCVTWAQRLKVMPPNNNVCHLSTESESDAPNDNVSPEHWVWNWRPLMTMCVTWALSLKVIPPNDNVCHLSTESESDAP